MAKPELDILRGDDPWDRAVAAGVALVLIMLFGTVAYRLLGLSWLDAFYQTLITVSTVGFTEVSAGEITPAYRLRPGASSSPSMVSPTTSTSPCRAGRSRLAG